MKNKSYIGISLILLVFGILVIPEIIDRVKNKTVVEGDRLNKVESIKIDSGLFTIGKVPNFSLIDQNGQKLTNIDMLGKVYVLEFFFSTCPSICPIMNRNLLDIEKEFYSNTDFGIVSISINPKYDTPEVLKNHAQQLNIRSESWYFLTTESQEYIHKLAQEFNMYVDENINAPGGFEHSGLFALIDKQGNIRSRRDDYGNPIMYYTALNYSDKDGFEEDFEGKFRPGVDAIMEDIKKLLNE